MSTYPVGWNVSSLSNLTEKPVKMDPVATGRKEVRYVDIGLLKGPSGRLGDAPSVEAAEAPSRCRQVIEVGDTLYSTVRPYLDKIALVGQGLDGEFASTGFCVLRPTSALLPEYLYYFSLSRLFRDQVLPKQKGVSYPAVLDREVRGVRIWHPDVRHQRRIVDILEDHLSRLDAAEASLTADLARLDVLERSILHKGLRGGLVSDDLSEGAGHALLSRSPLDLSSVRSSERTWDVPSTWAWTRLGDIFSVHVGATPPRGDASMWGGEIPWVSSGEVCFNRIGTTRETIAEKALANPSKRLHPPGTVMLAMIGEGKTRGQAAILNIAAAHNQNCASIRVGDTRVLPEFVYAFLKERYLETRRGSAGGNQPALNKRSIERIPLPIPPLATQRRLVATFDSATRDLQRLRASMELALSRSEGLRRALLESAFSGKLTGRRINHEAAKELCHG